MIDPTDVKPEFMQSVDPFALFETWFAEAKAKEINDPNAMALATVGADQLPNVRMVLLKGLDGADAGDARGFVFYTNLTSAKGRELVGTPKAALLFHWKSLRRQVRVRGTVTNVTAAEADVYYASRALGSRHGAWASEQSAELANRKLLEDRWAQVAKSNPGPDVPRPAHWSGFRVTPVEIEFWADGEFRLHDRLVFRRAQATHAWTRARLNP